MVDSSPGFGQAALLKGTGMEELAGLESQQKSTNIPNTLDLPQSVASIDQALVALVRYTTVVDELLQRAGDASTSSRLASRYQIIELIGTLFLKVLPAPDPTTVAIAFEHAKATEDWEDDEEDEPEQPPQPQPSTTTVLPTTPITPITPITPVTPPAATAANAAVEAAKEAEKAVKRQESALNLMAAYPQYEFDVIVGALEVSGDSISIAANLIFGKGNEAARELINAKRVSATLSTPSPQSNKHNNNNNGGGGGGNGTSLALAKEEEELYAKYYDTFGPERDVATQFREDLLASATDSPTDSPTDRPTDRPTTCIWSAPTTKENQLRMLQAMYKLLAVYGSMWQAIELPTREYDAERSCVAMCALAVFDILIRMPARDSPLKVSSLLARDGKTCCLGGAVFGWCCVWVVLCLGGAVFGWCCVWVVLCLGGAVFGWCCLCVLGFFWSLVVLDYTSTSQQTRITRITWMGFVHVLVDVSYLYLM
jgi:hypothetical protein